MKQSKFKAVFMRGGTSKALIFHERDLPADRSSWDALFLAMLGSPDANGRQLNGMGGGVASLSKVCIVGPPTRPDADVDYTFAQVLIRKAVVDYSANCGNMSSAIGPFAIDEGLVKPAADGSAVVKIHNTNTHKLIVARFNTTDGEAMVTGDFVLDGVAGSGAPIRLEFNDPGGAKTGVLLPTNATHTLLTIPGYDSITASLIDAASPCVFIDAAAMGLIGNEMPEELATDQALLEKFEMIRLTASVAMGITANFDQARQLLGAPRVAMIAGPLPFTTLSGQTLDADDVDLTVRVISDAQPHQAVPLTTALCLAVASKLPGTIPYALVRNSTAPLRIGNPSGITQVDAEVELSQPSAMPWAKHAVVYRTARRLFEGKVCCQASFAQ